ncbi:MAG: hypothetical protein JST86_12180 [Bacteroidetes bacterium]|nr:hypothetical protein [Bacteroidota bacterium]
MNSFSAVHAQQKNPPCNCPATAETGIHADTAFHFSNGKTIVACGEKNTDHKPVSFSAFVLAVCGQDTVLDFWDGTLTCLLKFKQDTLLVENLQYLPAGPHFKNKFITWTTERFYFSHQRLRRKLTVNRQIRKYTAAEIQIVLKAYETAAPGLDDSKMELAARLFMATVSGSKKARLYFNQFSSRFGALDGAFQETYEDLAAMLSVWDSGK